jgi:hypothetical protein
MIHYMQLATPLYYYGYIAKGNAGQINQMNSNLFHKQICIIE